MLGEGRMLTHQQAKAFYDRLGSKQDLQAFYEVPVTNNLIAHAALEQAQSVFEFGCGTGAFAERVLAHHCRYGYAIWPLIAARQWWPLPGPGWLVSESA